MTQFS